MTDKELLDLFRGHFEIRNWKLYWLTSSASRKAGDRAGGPATNGYWQVTLNGRLYLEHRVIWLMTHGSLPKMLDHINLNRADNRLENLRPASHSQNIAHSGVRANSRAGLKGVRFVTKDKKWRATLYVNKQNLYLGQYDDPVSAAVAYDRACVKHRGEFAVTNKSLGLIS